MRISKQLFFMVLGTCLVTVAAAMGVLFLSLSHSLEKQHEADRELLRESMSSQYSQYGNDLLDAIREAVINPLFLHETAQVQQIVSSFIGRGDIAHIYIFDTDWKVLVDGTANYASRGKHIGKLFEADSDKLKTRKPTDPSIHVQEIRVDGEYLLGGIALVLNRQSMLKSIEQQDRNLQRLRGEAEQFQIRMLGVLLPLVLVFSVAVSIFVAQYFTGPIKQVSQDVRSLEEGNYNPRLPIYRRDEIGDLARSLRNLATTLERNETFKSDLISSVSHELRTPLTSVLGFTKLISRDVQTVFPDGGQTDPERKRKVERIQANLTIITLESQRLTRLIANVLDLSKIEAGSLQLVLEPTPMAEPLTAAARSMAGVFAGLPEVALDIDIPNDLPIMPVDRDRIEQVVVNLLSNAAKFTEKGSVRLEASATGGNGIRVTVSDTGIGIPENMQHRIFERFLQVADSGRMKHNGTGLGLAICKEIVEAHDGRIWAARSPEGGSRFIFELSTA